MPAGTGSILMGTGKGRVEMYKPVPIPVIPSPVNPVGYPYLCRSLDVSSSEGLFEDCVCMVMRDSGQRANTRYFLSWQSHMHHTSC
jgi:hypothetical protein